MSLVVRVGKKYAIYLPKSLVKELGIKEGDKYIIEVRDRQIILKPLPGLFKERKYWGKISLEEIEKDSEELIEIVESEDN